MATTNPGSSYKATTIIIWVFASATTIPGLEYKATTIAKQRDDYATVTDSKRKGRRITYDLRGGIR